MDRLPVFVYGTLRPAAAQVPVARRLLREARHLGPARARGRLYRVDWYPGLVVDERGWVVGDLLALPPGGDLLARLDAYEEFDPARPDRGEFRRVARRVHGPDGPVIAWLYVYLGPRSAERLIPSGDFLDPS